MKNNLVTIVLVVVLLLLALFFVKPYINNVGDLTNPGFSKSQSSPNPTLAPPNAPKIFQFDSSTDLSSEFEKVDPQILDSDFE